MSNDVRFGGVPTAVDVRKLFEKFDVPAVGALLHYTAIEDAIEHGRSSFRFKTVVAAWRRRLLREHNLLLLAVANQGYTVANNSERVGHSANQTRYGIRKIVKASAIAELTSDEGLTDVERATRRKLAANGAAIKLALATSAKALA